MKHWSYSAMSRVTGAFYAGFAWGRTYAAVRRKLVDLYPRATLTIREAT